MVTHSKLTVVRHYDRVVGWSVLLLVLSVLVGTFVGPPETHDGEISFQTTSSLWRNHDFALDGSPEGTPEARYLIQVSKQMQSSGRGGAFPVQHGSDGEYYGWYGVGQAVVPLPLYGLGRLVAWGAPEIERRHSDDRQLGFERSEYFAHLFVGLRNPLLTALTAWMIVLCARRMSVRRWGAFLAGISYAFCTFAWPQGRSWLSDVQATFFLFAGFHLILRLREERARIGLRPSVLLLLGLSLGGAVSTRAVMAPAVLVLEFSALFVMFHRHVSQDSTPAVVRRRGLEPGWKAIAWMATPQLVIAALLLWVNHQRFSDPFDNGYGEVLRGGFFGYPPLMGLVGVLFSPGKGLLWMAPGVLLLYWGIPLALRSSQRVWFYTSIAMTIVVLLPVVCIQGWHGAWTFGPRYLLPLLPFLWLGVALGLEHASDHRFVAAVAAGLMALGFCVNLPAVLVDTTTYHQLAVKSARIAWTPPEGLSEEDAEAWLFERIQFDWGFAAPWAHWRIVRHRTAGLGEDFPVHEIFFVDSQANVRPDTPRQEGRAHFGWIDHKDRLGGRPWPALLAVGLLFALGSILAIIGLDHSAD
ncbi:MAG: phospholipid carrier-dependent glycosyltransferase [Planctomycetes bacterium]|nr:phospholipid carrier-dependent glycosyltransferase [Planctomycetota bacterium]MCB9905626.1 phospholipid carrier-dependent glycosyltransferase [Planctomycetota bacterium]